MISWKLGEETRTRWPVGETWKGEGNNLFVQERMMGGPLTNGDRAVGERPVR